MHAEETNIIEQSQVAEDNRNRTIACKDAIQANFIVLAKLFKDNRDSSLWKLLDYESFESYLGSPEIGFSRSKVYNLIHLYELFVEKLGMAPDEVRLIDQSKLSLIAPVVELDREGWLAKARHLSKSDLQIELGQGPGVTKLSPPPLASAPLTCINGCGPGERSHFPVTRGAGGQEVEDWWVPMCRECHGLFHADPKAFTWTYKREWAGYLYGLINRGE